MQTPDWALTLIYWVHMLATVAWLGGLAAVTLLVVPISRAALPPEKQAEVLERVQKRLDPLSWMSVILLAATGMFQMSANPNYGGLLAIDNRWAAALFIKHLLFLAMIAINALLTWMVLPGLRRAALLRLKGKEIPEDAERLQRREVLLLGFNLILGILVLALTAVARAA